MKSSASKETRRQKPPYTLPTNIITTFSAKDIQRLPTEMANMIDDMPSRQINSIKAFRRWDDLFEILEIQCEGLAKSEYQANYHGKLALRFEALTSQLKSDDVVLIVQALRALRKTSLESFTEVQTMLANTVSSSDSDDKSISFKMPFRCFLTVELAVEIISMLRLALGPDLHNIRYYEDKKKNSTNKIISSLKSALKACGPQGLQPKSHGRSETYKHRTTFGVVEAPLPWLALEIAKQLTEQHHRLPKKQEISIELIRLYPELKSKPRSSWAGVYRAAGLVGLDKAKEFSHPRYGRGKSPSPSQKMDRG